MTWVIPLIIKKKNRTLMQKGEQEEEAGKRGAGIRGGGTTGNKADQD